MGKKSGRNQRKKAAAKQETSTTKVSQPSSKTKSNKAHNKAHPKPNGVLFEVSGGPSFQEIGYPMEQQYEHSEWIYPSQFFDPWNNYVGYWYNNQFIHPGYFQPFPAWDNGNDAPNTAMSYADGNGQPNWDMSTFSEQVQTVDEVIAGITASEAQSTGGFRLRAEAPEFIPEQRIETHTV